MPKQRMPLPRMVLQIGITGHRLNKLDAGASADHLLAAQVLPGSFNLGAAKEALQEVYEIADVIVPGHDNVVLNPRVYGGLG